MESATTAVFEVAAGFGFDDVARLTHALKGGDEAAFSWLHHAWSRRINRYCFALAAGDGTFASEIAQATWLRLVKHVRVMHDEATLWNWIARAARNAATDARRKGSRYLHALFRFAESWTRKPATHCNDSPDHLLAALEAALEKLTPDERALIDGRYFAGDSLELIGRAGGLSARAVEGRLARLRARLRELIAEELKAL
jgi:RNA polymerase sigma factor (sigma-70 family)